MDDLGVVELRRDRREVTLAGERHVEPVADVEIVGVLRHRVRRSREHRHVRLARERGPAVGGRRRDHRRRARLARRGGRSAGRDPVVERRHVGSVERRVGRGRHRTPCVVDALAHQLEALLAARAGGEDVGLAHQGHRRSELRSLGVTAAAATREDVVDRARQRLGLVRRSRGRHGAVALALARREDERAQQQRGRHHRRHHVRRRACERGSRAHSGVHSSGRHWLGRHTVAPSEAIGLQQLAPVPQSLWPSVQLRKVMQMPCPCGSRSMSHEVPLGH